MVYKNLNYSILYVLRFLKKVLIRNFVENYHNISLLIKKILLDESNEVLLRLKILRSPLTSHKELPESFTKLT